MCVKKIIATHHDDFLIVAKNKMDDLWEYKAKGII